MIERQSIVNAIDLAREGDQGLLGHLNARLLNGEEIEGPSIADAPTALLVDALRERGVTTLSYPRTERIKMALDSLHGVIDSNERSLREFEATPATEEAPQNVVVDWIRAKREADRLTEVIRREFRELGGLPAQEAEGVGEPPTDEVLGPREAPSLDERVDTLEREVDDCATDAGLNAVETRMRDVESRVDTLEDRVGDP